MYDNAIKDQFVELRAAGKSFGDIAEQLSVSKSTLHPGKTSAPTTLPASAAKALGRRVEDELENLACRLIDWEQLMNNVILRDHSLRDILFVLRETRREYRHLRATLMGTPRRSTRKPAEGRATYPHGAVSNSVTPEVTTGLTSPALSDNSAAQPANAVQTQPHIEVPKSNKTERIAENPTTQPRNTNDLQQTDSQSFDFPERGAASTPTSEAPSPMTIHAPRSDSPHLPTFTPAHLPGEANHHSPSTNHHSLPDDDFLGSVVVNPYECAAAIVLKTLEQQAALVVHNGP